MSGRYTRSHPCMHSTQNTELWTGTTTQRLVGGLTVVVLYCAQMLLKFQHIASARQVCFFSFFFFAKLVSPLSKRTNWNSRVCCPNDTDLLLGVNHGAWEPLRPVSDSHHIISLHSSIGPLIYFQYHPRTGMIWTALIACSPRWWHQIVPGNIPFGLIGAEPIFYSMPCSSLRLRSLF